MIASQNGTCPDTVEVIITVDVCEGYYWECFRAKRVSKDFGRIRKWFPSPGLVQQFEGSTKEAISFLGRIVPVGDTVVTADIVGRGARRRRRRNG